MAKYRSIAVIYGSDSSEWEVACRSGEFVASRIDEFQYDVYEIFARFGKWNLVAMRKANAMRQPFPEGARPEIDKSDFSVMVLGEKIKFDFAYIMQHGAPGETGLLQGYLEMLGVPHSSCSAFVTTVAFDKYSCKSYLRTADFVKMAPDAFVRQGDDVESFSKQAVERLGLPLFVKPTSGGSSFGITKVEKAEDLPAAIRFAFAEGDTVIVEAAVKAEHELTCAVYFDGNQVQTLPVIEIISETGWFDYDAKYNGFSREVCPAEIPDTHGLYCRQGWHLLPGGEYHSRHDQRLAGAQDGAYRRYWHNQFPDNHYRKRVRHAAGGFSEGGDCRPGTAVPDGGGAEYGTDAV